MNLGRRHSPLALLGVGLLLVVLLVWSDATWAQASLDTADGMINEIGRRFQGQLAQWGVTIHAAATRIFWFLALVSLVWMGAQLIIRKGDISDMMGELLRYVMFLGFFWWLLQNAVDGANIANGLVNGLRALGDQASGFPTGFDVSQLVQYGLDLVGRSVDTLQWTSPASWFGFLLAWVVLVILVVIGVNFVLVKFGAYILIYAGIIYLGFGGAKWTSDIALNYFKACIAQGMKLLTMACMLSVSIAMMQEYFGLLGEGPVPLRTAVGFFVVTIVLGLFITKVPDIVAGVISGHVIGHGLGNIGVAAAAATMAAAIAPFTAAVKQMAGAAYAAYEAAKANNGKSSSGDSGRPPGASIASTSGPGGNGGAGPAGPAGRSDPASAAMGGSGAAAASTREVGISTAATGAAGRGAAVPDSATASRNMQPTATSIAANTQPAGSGSIGAGVVPAADTGFFGSLIGGAKDVVRHNLEATTLGGRVGGAIRDARLGVSGNRRELAQQGKGVQAADKEPNPQAELDAFVKGR